MATLDDLYDLRTYFYLGFYTSVIEEGSNLKLDNQELQFERDILLARSFIATGHYDKLMMETGQRLHGTLEFEALKILAAYMKSKSDLNIDQAMVANSCLDAVTQMAASATTVYQRLLLSAIYIHEGYLEPAFKLLIDCEHPECLAQLIQIYVRLYRFDLAEKALTTLKAKTNDSVLSQVTEATVLIAKGEDYQSAYYIFQELIEGNGQNGLLLNDQAVCCMHLDRWAEAENLLLDGLKKDPKNTELLINLMTVSNNLGKKEISEKCFQQISSIQPHHQFLKEFEAKTFQFRQLAQSYRV